MSEPIFVNGLIWKDPSPRAPDFIKGKLSIKVSELIAFLEDNQSNDWVNVIMKESKAGKIYFELDTWKPQTPNESDEATPSAMQKLNEGKVNPFLSDEVRVENIPFN